LVEGPESFSSLLTGTTSHAAVTATGSGSVNVTDNDSATVKIGRASCREGGGATSSPTATKTKQTTGTGRAALATAITGIALATAADYTASTASIASGATDGAPSAISVPAVDDQLVEGPESFSSLLTGTTSHAAVTATGSGSVNVTDNDSATV